MITQEMVRIDVDMFDDAAQTQLNNTPVMSRSAPAPRLPPIHPFAAVGVLVSDENSVTRLQEIFFLGEELIVREESGAADPGRDQINKTGGGRNG